MSNCQSYDEARQIYLEGELQAWDGATGKWEDIPAGSQPFFSRRVEEYRRRPHVSGPRFFARVFRTLPHVDGNFVSIRCFDTGREVADYLWKEKLAPGVDCEVYTKVALQSLDVRRIAEQLEAL